MIELTDVAFSAGVDFDFNDGTILQMAPGARLLVVRDLGAFEFRYGTGLPVAGVFANDTGLSNGGERLTLDDANGATIFDFVYNDRSPWPEEPDGGGPSLVYGSGFGPGDPGEPLSWRASATAGGTPGASDTVSLASWKAAQFTQAELALAAISGDDADPDGDEIVNFLEYVYGTDPKLADFQPTTVSLERDAGGAPYATIEVSLSDSNHVRARLQSTTDLSSWGDQVPGVDMEYLGSVAAPAGKRTLTFRSLQPWDSTLGQFYRFTFISL